MKLEAKVKKWPVEAVVDPEEVVHGLDLPTEPEEEISSNMKIHNSEMDLTKEMVLVLIIEDENPSWFFSPYNGIWQHD